MDNYNYKLGIHSIEKILKSNPRLNQEVDVLVKLGTLYDHYALQCATIQREKMEQKAIEIYRVALLINPQSPSATWGIGRIWWHRKDKQAIPYALEAFRLSQKKLHMTLVSMRSQLD